MERPEFVPAADKREKEIQIRFFDRAMQEFQLRKWCIEQAIPLAPAGFDVVETARQFEEYLKAANREEPK